MPMSMKGPGILKVPNKRRDKMVLTNVRLYVVRHERVVWLHLNSERTFFHVYTIWSGLESWQASATNVTAPWMTFIQKLKKHVTYLFRVVWKLNSFYNVQKMYVSSIVPYHMILLFFSAPHVTVFLLESPDSMVPKMVGKLPIKLPCNENWTENNNKWHCVCLLNMYYYYLRRLGYVFLVPFVLFLITQFVYLWSALWVC